MAPSTSKKLKKKEPKSRVIYTIGHSSLTAERFMELLEQNGIDAVVDVRTTPYSRHAPHFGQESLNRLLQSHKMMYFHMGDSLGGRPEEPEFYDSFGHVLYDKLAESPRFQDGLQRLMDGIDTYRLAIMCSEENPLDCHRHHLVGKVLAANGVRVQHIRSGGQVHGDKELDEEAHARLEKDQPDLFLDVERAWQSPEPVAVKKSGVLRHRRR
jgi:uncharacterized protein (DUF488 family)